MAITLPWRRGSASLQVSHDDDVEAMPIGDGSQDVFSCPTCSRPLAIGTSRCRGCGTILLVGVPARRASLFIGIGAVIGLIAGASFATVASGMTRPVSASGAGSGAAPGAVATVEPAPAVAPNAAANALRLTIAVDDRLSASEVRLKSLLNGSFDTIAVANLLRAISADAAWGSDVVGRMADWPAAADLQPRLRDEYRRILATAKDGLNSTITSASAYRTAARRMLAHTSAIAALRAESATLAAAYGIDLAKP
jgi:hypothetical protein